MPAMMPLLDPSYPTGSLDFLQNLRDSTSVNGTTFLRLNIVIIGAGIGGLSTAVALARDGHAVTVLEQACKLGEVGAGIQMPPNSARLLLQWGLGPYIKNLVVKPNNINFRRWQSGDVIGLTKLVPDFDDKFGAPYYVIHRAHLHQALHTLAENVGVEIRTNSLVTDIDPEMGAVTISNSTILTGDLVVGADGIKSIARRFVLPACKEATEQTGFAAYRATVDTKLIAYDPETAWLLEQPDLNLWVGDQRHVMTYMISSGSTFNMVLSHPDTSDPKMWDQASALSDMQAQFGDWDPRLQKIIGMVKKTMKWPLLSGVRLERWVHRSNKLIILGDAAHAMLPYMSQGAAMAVEDGAALARAIQLAKSKEEIGRALRIWESVRIERASQMQEASRLNGTLWHFKDGIEQEARDAGMQPEVMGQTFASSPNQWSDPTTQRWCYSYDAVEEISKSWKKDGLTIFTKMNGY